MEPKSVAAKTLGHMGGQRTLAMIGASAIAHDNTGAVTLRVGKNALGVTHLRVRVGGDDLYVVETLRVRGAAVRELSNDAGVPASALRETVERVTGMATRL